MKSEDGSEAFLIQSAKLFLNLFQICLKVSGKFLPAIFGTQTPSGEFFFWCRPLGLFGSQRTIKASKNFLSPKKSRSDFFWRRPLRFFLTVQPYRQRRKSSDSEPYRRRWKSSESEPYRRRRKSSESELYRYRRRRKSSESEPCRQRRKSFSFSFSKNKFAKICYGFEATGSYTGYFRHRVA